MTDTRFALPEHDDGTLRFERWEALVLIDLHQIRLFAEHGSGDRVDLTNKKNTK